MTKDPLDRVKEFFSAEEPDPRPRLGRYRIVREVARGGMAVVYEAADPDLGRRVALKVLKEGNVERLRREAAAAAQLRHPNVVAVHEVGPDFIAMDFVEGRSFAELLPSLSPADRLRVLETVARAVGEAHAQGIVHRDLKPGNVIVEPGGRPVLTDFGLAKFEGGEDLTRTGSVIGTPHYMAPEQVRGEKTGPAADIWALGVMLYEIASGRKPFEGATPLAIYERITREDPAPIPGDLGAVAAKALEKDPARRYPSAADLAEELRRHREGEPVRARPAGPGRRLWRRMSKHPGVFAAGSVAALALAAAAVFALAGKVERDRALEVVRDQARVSLAAALELRRAGGNARMRQFLPPLESAYREALRRAPGLAEADYLMGRMHRALLEDEKALEFQERALRKDPRFAPALYERAVLLSLAHGRQLKHAIDAAPGSEAPPERRPLAEAIARDCEAFLKRRPAGLPPEAVLVAEGLLAFHRGRTAEARARLDEAVGRDPLLDEAREALTQVVRSDLLAAVEERERAWKAAEDLYAQGLERDRGFVPHYLGRGQLRWSRGSARRHRGLDPLPDYGAAADDFAKAIELAGTAEAWTWRGQARVYHAIYRIEILDDPGRDLAAAEADLTRAVELDPSHGRGWLWRGNARFYRGLWRLVRGEDARSELEAAERDHANAAGIADTRDDARKWRGRARALLGGEVGRRGGDPAAIFEGAEADFAATLPRAARDSWMWTWRSTVFTERGLHVQSRGADPRPDFARAEEHLNEAIRLNRHHMEGWKHRGFLHWHRARHLEAKADRAGARDAYAAAASDFHQALSINPTLRFQIGDRLEQARRKVVELSP